jgi:hypothetical protein
MKKLLLFLFVVVIIGSGCKKSETPTILQETTYESLGTGYVLSSEFTITEIGSSYDGVLFTLKDSKYIFTAKVIYGTKYIVGDKITGIQLDAILSKNNYQIPKF